MSNYVETRPWGSFEILEDNPCIKVKIITVNPGNRLSYQYHAKREETWYVLSGKGLFTLNDVITEASPGWSLHIPAQWKHRMANNGLEILKVLEVQNGTYFGEDDIIRIQDDYNREVSNG